MKPIVSAQGWALDIAVELDRHLIGFAGHFLRASDERRQVLAAYFSVHLLVAEALESSAMAGHAQLLLGADHQDVLAAAYGAVPAGMRRALARAGGQPHDPKFYCYLHNLLSCPPHSKVASTLGQIEKIDFTRLRVLKRLPASLACAQVVSLMPNVDYVTSALSLIDLLVSAGVDRDALADALMKIENRTQLNAFWQRWSLKTNFPSHPVPASQSYRPVQDGEGLKASARRFRNCSERYLAAVLDGKCAFAEFEHLGQLVVVHLRNRQGKWMLDDVYGRQNRSVGAVTRSKATEYLASHGVLENAERQKASIGWEALRDLTSGIGFYDEDDEDV